MKKLYHLPLLQISDKQSRPTGFLFYRQRLFTGLVLIGLLTVLSGCSLAAGRGIEGQIIFEDRFRSGETGRWLTESDEVGRSLVVNEVMVIELDQPNTIQYVALEEPGFANFVAAVDVTQTEGSPNSSFGMFVRMQGADALYRFAITGNGLYAVEIRTPAGGWARLTDDWTATPHLRQGLNQTNRLRVEAVGPQMTFFVNDEQLTQIVDSTFVGGNIALSAGTFNQGGLRVAFDNVVVTRP